MHVCTKFFTASFILLALSACSTANWYDGFKNGQRFECEKLQGSTRDECLERLNYKSYEEYKESREQLKKDS